MCDSRASGGELHIAPAKDLPIAERIIVLQMSVDNVAVDLKLSVTVRTETRTGSHAILVDHLHLALVSLDRDMSSSGFWDAPVKGQRSHSGNRDNLQRKRCERS